MASAKGVASVAICVANSAKDEQYKVAGTIAEQLRVFSKSDRAGTAPTHWPRCGWVVPAAGEPPDSGSHSENWEVGDAVD